MNDTTSRQQPSARWTPQLPLTLSETPDLATAATMLAEHGTPCFPCHTGGKQPLTTHGFHDASTARTQITAWWRRWPDANIGVPTGEHSGIDVVDVDVHAGGNGFGAFEGARARGIAGDWAWLVRTPSGGLHAYFLRLVRREQRSWQIPGKHIDFRGDGGYIVIPPSRVTTDQGEPARYEVIAVAQHRPGTLDADRLRRFLDPPPKSRPPAGLPALESRPDKLAAWVASRPEGGRNHGLFWAACRMAEDGHTFDAATTVLGDAARAAGLDDREAQATIRSAFRTAIPAGASSTGPTAAVEGVRL